MKRIVLLFGAALVFLGAGPAMAHPHACCLPEGECVEVLTYECFDLGGNPAPLETPCSDVVKC